MSVASAKLDKFSAAVLRDAEEHRSKILKEIEDYRKNEMDKAEEEILHEAYVMIQNEIASIRNDHTRRISRAELDGRRDLLIYRENLTGKVFDEVREKLTAFTKSDDYLKYMTDLIKNSADRFSGENIVIEVKKDDLTLADRLTAALGHSAKVTANPNIKLGGFILSNNDTGVVIDETLDLKLNNQKDWFSSKSGLSIDM